MSIPGSRPEQINLGRKTQRQILIVFLVSVLASSVMIFFYVSSKTAAMLEQKQLESPQKVEVIPEVTPEVTPDESAP